MLLLELQKIRNKKWMFACLLLGAVLLFASAVSFPMYRTAVLDRMLEDQLEEYITGTGKWPMQMNFFFQVGKSPNMDAFDRNMEGAHSVYAAVGVPEYRTICYYSTIGNKCEPELAREEDTEFSLKLASITELEDHIKLIDGHLWEDEDPSDGTIAVIVSEQTFLASGMVLGDVFSCSAVAPKGVDSIKYKVVGVFDAEDPSDVYWQKETRFFSSAVFVRSDLFLDYFREDIFPLFIKLFFFILRHHISVSCRFF